MKSSPWCEHAEKQSKFVTVNYRLEDEQVSFRIQTWYCAECGVHGARSEREGSRSPGGALEQK